MPWSLFVVLFAMKGFIVCADGDDKVTYRGYQVWKANVGSKNMSAEFINKLSRKDIWHVDDNNIDFLLNGSETSHWHAYLDTQNVSYKVLLDDVQDAIEKEEALHRQATRRGSNLDWNSYAKLNDIYSYLKKIASANPNSCKLQSIGKTIHKKDIQMLKLSNGKPSNEAILLEAGMHGREWVAVASLLYFVETIAWNFTSQPNYIKNKDWYIVPVVNPDGYEYSMTTDRMWRKNRRKFSGPCDGVDINRNFDTNWCERGASAYICAIDYCGPDSFSEQESIAIRDVVRGHHFHGYASIHSYGTAVFYPWAMTGKPTPDVKGHKYVAKEMIKAMYKIKHENFKAGTVDQLRLDRGSGMCIDWVYKEGVKHAYLIESRGWHFQLATNEILAAAQEVTAGLRRMAEII